MVESVNISNSPLEICILLRLGPIYWKINYRHRFHILAIIDIYSQKLTEKSQKLQIF